MSLDVFKQRNMKLITLKKLFYNHENLIYLFLSRSKKSLKYYYDIK